MEEKKPPIILVVDDDRAILELLKLALADLDAKVLTAENGEAALRIFLEELPDLVILDAMLPLRDGFEVCHQLLQARPDLPIVFLTVLGNEHDILRAFNCGAVDYITKPFSPRVLVARILAALGKVPADNTSSRMVYQDPHLFVDLENRSITVQGKEVKLTHTEFQLLSCLMLNTNHTLGHEQILRLVWGIDSSGNAEYIHSYIWRLRHKLEPDPLEPIYLINDPGVGYRFESRESAAKTPNRHREDNTTL
jgi:two-component system, OmpR family, KDP operon response regulator KdpE